MKYFDNSEIEDDDKRNGAFTMVNAIREGLTIARRTPQHISYEKSLDYLEDIDPILYEKTINLLPKKNESDVVKFYKELGLAKGQEPFNLIENDLKEFENLVLMSENDTSYIQKKILDLKAAKDYFMPRNVSEHRILARDFSLAGKHSYFGKELYEDEVLRDYKLSDDRILRIRLAHPDKYEHEIGCDLIYEQFDLRYEQFDLRYNTVRFIHLQYKTWNSNTLYFSSTANLKAQVDKLSKNICGSGFCKGEEDKDNFRFPYCSAFLRPTSKILRPENKLVSTGEHVPICKVKELELEGKITNDNIKDHSVGHKIFEELFIRNSLGSRRIYIDTLEKFYSEKGLLSDLDRIRVHMSEVFYENDSERIKRTGRG